MQAHRRRHAAKEARRTGRATTDKRVRWRWRDEGLRAPTKKRKERLAGVGVHVGALRPLRPDLLCALDVQFDTLASGRTSKMLNVIDEFTSECQAVEVGHSVHADDVVEVLDQIALECGGTLAFPRMDNGPERVAWALADWCWFNDTASAGIDPDSLWQNAEIESFNGRFLDALVNLRKDTRNATGGGPHGPPPVAFG